METNGDIDPGGGLKVKFEMGEEAEDISIPDESEKENTGNIMIELLHNFGSPIRPSDLWWARVNVPCFQNMAHHFPRQ